MDSQSIAAELLTALTERCQDMAFAHFIDIPPEDVAYALGTMPDKVSKYMRLKYAGQNEYRMDIERALLLDIVELWIERGYKHNKTRDFLRDMGRMALAESVFPHVCLTCQGTKSQILLQGKVENCPSCGGSGKRRPSYRERAQIMGFKPTTWRVKWNSKYLDILKILDQWESEGIGQIKRKLPEYFHRFIKAEFR